jgi:hypothetical protein
MGLKCDLLSMIEKKKKILNFRFNDMSGLESMVFYEIQ